MTIDKWQRLKQVFQAAMELDPGKRTEFVRRSCADDPEICEEALRLFAAMESIDSGFLRPPGPDTLLDRAAKALGGPSRGYEGQLLAGRYFVEKVIAHGGSGTVYLAQDRNLHSRPVVVKFLDAPWERHERLRYIFRREIEALSRLNHPGVVGALDVGQAPDGRASLVMEYVDGVTLRSRLCEGPLSFVETAAIVGPICEALATVHRNGILHRDLKPENIMLTRNGGVKLIDFGIAKLKGADERRTQAETAVIATVLYAAPEQLLGMSCLQSDIYALAVVVYEMLTGRRPFETFQLRGLINCRKKIEPLPKCIPKAASGAVLRALSFDPADRQGTAKEFAAEFRGELRARRRRRRFRVWTAAAVLLVGMAAGGWRLWDRGWGSYESVIEFAGGRDPEEFGFRPRLDVVEHVIQNPEGTGYDGIRLVSSDQGAYYHRLTRAQAYAAIRKGWKIEATMEPVAGGGATGADLTPAGGRYDIQIVRNASGRQVVLLINQIEKGIAGPTYEIEGAADVWHDYQLTFEPGTGAARLLVDGVERLRGYRGHHEYCERLGVTLATALYKSSRSEAMFKRVRFEINR